MSSSLVNNKYRITRRIGGGSFGEIYLGVGPNNEKVAVKFERHGSRCPQLRHEYKVYRELVNCHGFASVYHFGTQDNYNVMVMDLLGPSLEDLFNKCNRRFSLKTVLQMADQLLERVDALHARHLIHRDIKPANFVIGIGELGGNVYCVDFGLSKRYRHPKNLQHIPHRDGRSLTGTPRYASINNHLGIEQSRRDDLESIGYVLVYFLKGTLPWQGLKAKNAQKKYRLILEKKQQVSIAQLCQGCPSQFAEFLAYTRSLKFDAKPDIPYLRKLFRDLYHAQGCGSVAKLWDWDNVEPDYLSNTGTTSAVNSARNPTSAMIGGGQGPINTRPTTAAAINGNPDATGILTSELDVEYHDNVGRTRPSTAGAYGNRAGGAAPATTTWGYTRPSAETNGLPNTQQGSDGIAILKTNSSGPSNTSGGDYGVDHSVNRRPHTAHGAHGARVGSEDGDFNEGEEDHVVAGSRGLMRYRRNRATTMDPTPNGGNGGNTAIPGQQVSSNPGQIAQGGYVGQGSVQGSGTWSGQQGQQPSGSANWGYAQTAKNQLPINHQGYIPGGAGQVNRTNPSGGGSGNGAMNVGWPTFQSGATIAATDRPKSATGAGGSQGNILMTSLTGAGRPTSSNQMIGGGMNNWNSQGNDKRTQVQQHDSGASATNSNGYSYGSLKNRFLSGGGGGGGGGSGAGKTSGQGQQVNSRHIGNNNRSSKLFSLAR